MKAYRVTIRSHGTRGTYITDTLETIKDDLTIFCDEEVAGGEFIVELVDMTQEQIDALGEFEGF